MSEWNAETAEWYASRFGDYPTNKLGIDQLKLQDDSIVVDVGCGTGSALRYAASKMAGGQFIGIDPVPRMLEIAAGLTEDHAAKDRIEYRLGPAENLPVEDSIANWVLAFDSIDHWQDVDQGLAEGKRVLRSDGLLAIVKDRSVPGAQKSVDEVAARLEFGGFAIESQQAISADAVEFFLLISGVPGANPD